MHLGLIGHGNIARSLLRLLAKDQTICPDRVTILARPERADAVRAEFGALGMSIAVVAEAEALCDAAPDLVIECATQVAARDLVPKILSNGIKVVLVSIGALADQGTERACRQAAAEGGARLILTTGAVGGIDIVAALSAEGDMQLTYRGTKPPASWKASAAEALCDLDTLAEPFTFFSGTARQAALDFPKNANVAATLALAGPGFDRTRVDLVADPSEIGNIHSYTMISASAEVTMRIEGTPSPSNPRTSMTTIFAVLREIRNHLGPVVI